MDSATNDLDLETLDLLQEMIDAYEGTVILSVMTAIFWTKQSPVIRAEGAGVWWNMPAGIPTCRRNEKPMKKPRNVPDEKPIQKPKSLIKRMAHCERPSCNQADLSRQICAGKIAEEMDALRAEIATFQKQLDDPTLTPAMRNTRDLAKNCRKHATGLKRPRKNGWRWKFGARKSKTAPDNKP